MSQPEGLQKGVKKESYAEPGQVGEKSGLRLSGPLAWESRADFGINHHALPECRSTLASGSLALALLRVDHLRHHPGGRRKLGSPGAVAALSSPFRRVQVQVVLVSVCLVQCVTDQPVWTCLFLNTVSPALPIPATSPEFRRA